MGLFDFSFDFSKSTSNGGGTSIPMSKELMQFQSDQWRGNTEWFNKNGYKFLRQGLIDADYNPILAIGSSPLNGTMPTATATEGTTANGRTFNWKGAESLNAQTAKRVGDSQIMVNKSTANKLAEEALTQQNVRNNLDSQSLLNMLQSEEIQRLLPYKEQKMLAEIAVADSLFNLNNVTAEYVPYNAESTRTSANAAMKNAEVNEQWTPAKVAGGALAGLIGATGLGRLSKIGKVSKYLKGAKGISKLGRNGYKSSSAQYFTTLH